MPRVTHRPGSAPTPPAPQRSADFLPALTKPLSAAEKKAWGRQADAAIGGQLERARGVAHPDLKAVFAEEAGNLLVIRRALAGHPRWDEADTQKLADQVKGLLDQIVDARIARLQGLAANPGGPDAIREGEREAESLKTDLSRLTRFGFQARNVDVGGFDHAIKQAVVDAVAGGGRRGWSPR